MKDNPTYLLNSLFKGWVKVVDLDAEQCVNTYHEHRGRVWNVENVLPHTFGTCADDKSIKLWDIRVSTSIKTLRGQPGRVSCFTKLGPTSYVSASCPDNVWGPGDKASLTYWDIRMT